MAPWTPSVTWNELWYILQEPDIYDLESTPGWLRNKESDEESDEESESSPSPFRIPICQVSYDSIYDDPDFWSSGRKYQ